MEPLSGAWGREAMEVTRVGLQEATGKETERDQGFTQMQGVLGGKRTSTERWIAAMSSGSEVNQSRTSVGQSQTGKLILCLY